MHIYSIHLRHFRRFSKLTVYPIANLNVIIGPNNSGKSSIFHALDLALNPAYHPYIEDLIGKFDFHNGDLNPPIEIWLFLHLDGSDPQELRVQFGDKMSRWVLADKKSRNGGLQESTDQEGLPFIPAVKQPMDEEQIGNNDTGIIELLAVRFSAVWQKESGGFELSWKIVDEVGDEIPFTQADRRAIGFTRIPTHRDPAHLLGFSRRSLLGKNLEAIEISGPLHDILEKIEELKTPLKQTASVKKVLNAVQKTITDLQLIEGEEEVEATITFLKAEIGRLRGALELAFDTISKGKKAKSGVDTDDAAQTDDQQDSRFTVPLSYQGDGIQNALLISMFSLKSATKVQSIEAIEEPEQSLEPWRVRSLLKKIASSSSSQLFITTHSPAAVGEINGVDNLFILVPINTPEDQKKFSKTEIKVVHGRNLPDPIKKEFERARDIYARCLFARLILIVEGQSEMGYLPIVLSFAAKKCNGPDLSSLGLELFENFDNKKDMEMRAVRLKSFGKQVAVLIDHDESKKGEETTQDRVKKSVAVAANTFVWCKDSILAGAHGCDLEIMIAEGTPLSNLINAIKEIYNDPGHEINKDKWKAEYSKFLDANCDLIRAMPTDFPEPDTYQFHDIDEKVARLTLFALMHIPHSFKSSRDMRRLAELLGDTVPEAVMCLYSKLRDLLENRSKSVKSGYWDLHKGEFFDTN